MIRLSQKLPRKIAVAVSGGCDSMAALDFLRRSHDVLVLHYNHGTEYADVAQDVVRSYCHKHSLKWIVEKNSEKPPKGESLENFWRMQRYDFFESARDNRCVVTCHHLDDVVETWLFSSMHGNPFLIPDMRDCYVRPFLQTRKKDFKSWCSRKNVKFLDDPSNRDIRFMRNFIRHEVLPKVMTVNPGIHKAIAKKLAHTERKKVSDTYEI